MKTQLKIEKQAAVKHFTVSETLHFSFGSIVFGTFHPFFLKKGTDFMLPNIKNYSVSCCKSKMFTTVYKKPDSRVVNGFSGSNRKGKWKWEDTKEHIMLQISQSSSFRDYLFI